MVPGSRQGMGYTSPRGDPVHTLPSSRQWMMDKACPSLRTKIIPFPPALLAHGWHLSPTRADVTPQDPSKVASLLLLAFPEDEGLWAPGSGLRAGGFMIIAVLWHPGDRRGNGAFMALIHLFDSEV